MKVAFLFLTLRDLLHNSILDLVDNNDVYMHPKFINDISKEHQKFIIPNEFIIETRWGDMSLVNAMINLLTYAYSKKKYDYFVILSDDTYPAINKEKFEKFLKSQNGLSCFEYIGEFYEFSKSYAWWLLNYKDTGIIINSRDKYKDILENKRMNGTMDENYFLTVLKKEVNNYKFNNKMVMYTRWLNNTIVKNPIIFNKLTKYDILDIKNSGAPFMRKTLKTFSFEEHKTKDKLLIAIIGESTNQGLILEKLNNFDLVIFCIKEYNGNVLESLKDNCLMLINIIWKKLYDSILAFLDESKGFLNQYREILISTEKYNFASARIDKYIISKYPEKYLLLDEDNNKSYLLKTPTDDIIKFNKICTTSKINKKLVSISFIKTNENLKTFGNYEKHLVNFLDIFKKIKNHNLRIYVDNTTIDNKIIENLKKQNFVDIISFECKNFKDGKYHSNLFGELIKLYPTFDYFEKYDYIKAISIDLPNISNYFTGREESIMKKNHLELLFLRHLPNNDNPVPIFTKFMLCKVKFRRSFFFKLIENIYLLSNNKLNKNINNILSIPNEKAIVSLVDYIDNYFFSNYLSKFMQTNKLKYGMRAEIMIPKIIKIINKQNLINTDQEIIKKIINDPQKHFYLFLQFIQKFKNKINKDYDELIDYINKNKDKIKGQYMFFLIPK